MSKKRQCKSGWLARLPIILFVLCLQPFVSSLFAQQAPPAETITGIPGTAKYRATVNFQRLAEFENQARIRGREIKKSPRETPFKSLYEREEEPGDTQQGSPQPMSAQPMMMAPGSSGGSVGPNSIAAFAGPSPSPSTSFSALDDNDTAIPPDTMGAVGPNHVMTTLNTQIRIQDRQGAVLSTVDLNTFWAQLGFPDAFDPKVVYDPYEQRFIFTACADQPQIFGTNIFLTFGSSVLLAVSETSDPTGNWLLYRVFVDTFGNKWADYPSIGFNKDWIVVSVNMYTLDFFSTFAGVQIYVFDKKDVSTNALGLAKHTLLHVPTDPFFGLVRAFNLVPAVTYDRNLSEMYLTDIFEYGNNNVNSRLRLSTITGEVGREVLRLGTSLTAPNVVNWAPAPLFGSFLGFAPQLGSFFPIENNDGRIQNVVYRNGSLWCTHTVFLPTANPTHSAVQWWQIGPTPTNAVTHQFGRLEDTNAVNFYAFPSIAVNRCNDAMIGYSSFSSNQFASAEYTFRFANDPTNELRTPAVLKQGEGPYFKIGTTSRNRWGDYSATMVDPINDLDMWTIQEYARTPQLSVNFFGDGRWGTWWGKVEVAGLAQCGQVEFATQAYSVLENEPSGLAVITITNLTGTAGTVKFATVGGTAEVGLDYLAVTNVPVTFAAGEKSKTVELTIYDEGDLRSNRTVNLLLYDATNGISLGTLNTAVLTIIDDEFVPPPNIAGEFNFSTYHDTNTPPPWMHLQFGPSYFVTDWEWNGTHFCGTRTIIDPERRTPGAIVTITRSAPARGRVMVDFTTAEGGTAVPFQDYTPTNYTLIFDDYQMSTNVLVPIIPELVPNGDKYIRLVLSNPRPAPEEDTENPGMIQPTLGPGAASQVVIIEITHGDRLFSFFGGFFFNTLSNYIPAFAFERFNYRVDEYPDSATDISGGIREIPVDIVFPFPFTPRDGGRVIFRTDDRRVAGVRVFEPIVAAGSDIAECWPAVGGDPLSGGGVFPNPIYTDPSLSTITNTTDYAGVDHIEISFSANQCRQRVLLQITNDPTVEYNEDIVCRLFGIVGEDYFPHFYADQCTVTILYHDQPAGALDREWNPDNVARNSANGDFNPAPGANDIVYTVAVQPDGKTLLGGDFNAVNTQPRTRIARLNSNGLIDLDFDPGGGADGPVVGISLVGTNSGAGNAGKILICGSFTSFDSYFHRRITRLQTNGQIDLTFNPGTGANGPIWAIAQQSDGKIIVAGNFTQFNNVDRRRVARLFPDGTLDLSFNANPGPDFGVNSVAVVPNGFGPEKILLGGDFLSVNGQPNFRIAQLLNDGSLDPGFSAGAGADRSVYSVLVQPDGRILAAGAFIKVNDTPRVGIARLFPDGSLDQSFDPVYGANDSIYTMTLQPDGKILIGGVFTEYNRTRRMAMARLRPNGTLDTSFLDTAYNQFAGFTQPFFFQSQSFVNAIALEPTGDVMVGGAFLNVGGNPAARHALRNNYTVFTRADKRNRANIVRLLGGVTPGPGNAEFDTSNYFVDEHSPTVSIRMNRTDGRLGTLLGGAVTSERIAMPGFDYTQSTNNRPWVEPNRRDQLPMTPRSVGQVSPVFFQIPLLDDTLEEGDELVDLTFIRAEGRQNLFGEIIPLGAALGRSSALLNLVDNDRPRGEFNFLFSNYATNEFTTNRVTAVITVIRTNGSHGDVSVEYFTRNSPITPSATGCIGTGCDYEPINPRGRLEFASGQTTNFFTVTLTDDDIIEFDENIQLVLTNATGGAKLPGGLKTSIATATLTIIDNDFQPGRLNFTVNTFTNSETEGFATIVATRSGGTLGTVTAQYRMVDGTATSPADYQSGSGTLTWNNGDTTPKIIQVPLTQDGLVEGPQNFRVQLFDPRVGGATDARLLGSRTNSLVVIADGDAYGTVAFNQPYYHADEGGNTVSITVVRTAGISDTLTVDYTATPDSAVPVVDFTPVSGTLTFVQGQTSSSFLVPLADDSDIDGNKVVRLRLMNPAPAGAALGLLSDVTLTLVDNESFANPPGENDRDFQATAGASGPVYALGLYLTNGVFDGRLMIAGAFTNVNNITRQSVARLKPDALLDTTFDIGVGPNGAVRSMAVQSDGKIVLGGEFTQVTGTNRNGIVRLNIEGTLDRFFNPGAGADGPVYALALQPDEKILVGGAFSRFNEEQRPRLVRLNTNATVDITFNAGAGPNGLSATIYALALQSDGKVLVGGEFTQFDGVNRNGLVRLHRDGRVDMSFNPGSGFNAAVRSIAVEPNGKIVVGGSFTTVNGVARNFLARLDALGNVDTQFLSGLTGADNTVSALALQVDGKIMVAGDFTRFNGVTRNRLTRLNPDGTTDPTINFGTGADSFISAVVIQPDRKIVIGGGFTAYDGQPRRRFARLYGGSVSGPGSLEFLTDPFLAEENATNALVVVRRRGGTTGAVSVNAATFDGTALAGRDYVATNVTLAFPEGEAVRNMFVRVLDNAIPNVDRALGLALNNYSGATVGSLPISSLVILNDEALVSFSITNFVTSEGDPSGITTISAVRTLGTNTPFTVNFSTVGGSATPGADYLSTNGTLFFNQGDLVKNFHVPILNDTIIEGNESVGLVLQTPSARAFLGTNTATLSILDNDFAPGQILLASSGYVVDEAGGSVEITILRTNGRTGDITFDITTVDGTAQEGLDYIRTNATITFFDGELVKKIRVPILVDFIQEPSETFSVVISRPTGGATLVNPTAAVVTILNNDRPHGTFVLSSSSFIAIEGAPFLNLVVHRVNGPVSNATVNFTTTAINATANVDYGHISGTLTFPPGVTNQLVQIPIYDDALREGAERFNFALSSPSFGSGLGTPSTAIVDIIDNDSPILVAAGATLVSETNNNSVIDAGERVTLRFGIRNIGFTNTASLNAAVQLTGGVLNPVPVNANYGVVVANGPTNFQNITLTANVTNNGLLTVSLVLTDAGQNLGTLTYQFRVGSVTYNFVNTNRIVVNDNAPATPYPSPILVSDVVGTISKVTATVRNMTHNYPTEMDLLLVSPDGEAVMLMSDAGGNIPINNVTIRYTDSAPSAPSFEGPLISGDCLPINYSGDGSQAQDFFPPPAPAATGTWSTTLSTFNGKNANGVWSLYVVDDTDADGGVINSGWSLSITTSSPVNDIPPTLQHIGVLPNGQYRMAVRGQPGLRYSLSTSDDLRNYVPLQTFTMPNGGVYYYQQMPTGGSKFFRASKMP